MVSRGNSFGNIVGAKEILNSSLEGHTLVLGLERSGKTATILKPLAYEILKLKSRGFKLGLSVIEPNGDLSSLVAEMAKEMKLTYTHIDVSLGKKSAIYNPLIGSIEDVSDILFEMLKIILRDDPSSLTNLELIVEHVMRLLKSLYGDDLDILYMLKVLSNPLLLKKELANYKTINGYDNIASFFEYEVFNGFLERYVHISSCIEAELKKRKQMIDKLYFSLSQESIDINQHLNQGHVLSINTKICNEQNLNNAFGTAILMGLQNATMKRSVKSKIPHIILVDDCHHYINQDTNLFLSLSKKQNVTGVFSTHSLSNLKRIVRNKDNCILDKFENKIVFGSLTIEDAYTCSEIFGEEAVGYYNGEPIIKRRFNPSDILNGLSQFQFIHQLVKGGKVQVSDISTGLFVPKDWKERKEWNKETFLLDNFE